MWLAWSAATLLAASFAMTLPVSNSSPWTEAMHAPPLARWDAVWYRSVAVDGYSNDPSALENNVGFYPLYPLALRALSRLLPVNILWIGIGLSLACLLGALLLAGRLFLEWGGEAGAIRGAAPLLREARASEAVEEGDALILRTATRARGVGIDARASLDPSAPLLLEARGRAPLAVRRITSATRPGQSDGHVVTYVEAFPGVDARTFAREDGIEDLLTVRRAGAEVAYEVDVPPGHTLHRPEGLPSIVELRDARGVARFRVNAEKA
ncbi:MAG TPA: hypothetical protein VIZ69_03675, partial [Thermoanaerobaculia bacterium]